MDKEFCEESELEHVGDNRQSDQTTFLELRDIGRTLVSHLFYVFKTKDLNESEKHVEVCAECIESLVLATASIILDGLTDPAERSWDAVLAYSSVDSELKHPNRTEKIMAATRAEAKEIAENLCKKRSTMTSKWLLVKLTESIDDE